MTKSSDLSEAGKKKNERETCYRIQKQTLKREERLLQELLTMILSLQNIDIDPLAAEASQKNLPFWLDWVSVLSTPNPKVWPRKPRPDLQGFNDIFHNTRHFHFEESRHRLGVGIASELRKSRLSFYFAGHIQSSSIGRDNAKDTFVLFSAWVSDIQVLFSFSQFPVNSISSFGT